MLEKIFSLIETYFVMNRGEHIKNYEEEIPLLNSDIQIVIRRRALKHIVEQRLGDNYSIDDFKQLFRDLHRLLISNTFKIIKNKSDDENSFLLIPNEKVVGKGIVMAMERKQNNKNLYFIKTGFYRSATKIINLQSK